MFSQGSYEDNLNIKTLDEHQKINNCLIVRNYYKSTRVGSKSTSIGIFDWVSRLHKTDKDMQVSENYYQSTSRKLLVDYNMDKSTNKVDKSTNAANSQEIES